MNSAQQTQWTTLRKKSAGPLKLSAIKKMEVGLTDDSNRLSDPVVVTITCGDHTRTLVVHRPVGATSLQRDDWVLTPIDEVETLLAYAVDPAKEKKEAAKRLLRIEVAKKLGHYKEVDKKLLYTADPFKGAEVSSFRREAQAAYEKGKLQARAEYISECEAKGRKPKDSWSFGKSVNHFLDQGVKDLEAKITESVVKDSAWTEGLKKIEPQPYETKSGPFQDRPQSAVYGTGRITATKTQMVDQIYKHLLATMSGGYIFPCKPPKSLSVGNKPDEEETGTSVGSSNGRPSTTGGKN